MTHTLKVLRILAASFAFPQFASAAEGSPAPMGTKPGYLQSIATDVPNAAAIGRRIYVPGLEEDWVPQGLAVVGEHILVSSYKPTPDIKADKGPCRIFRVDAATGKSAGQVDIPLESCHSHAGGMAYLGDGRLVLADTQKISLIDLPKAMAAASATGAIRTVEIGGALRGSFAASQGGDAWIGHWSRDASKSRLFKLGPDFFEHKGALPADEALTSASIAIPVESQGAAFDAAGNLWVTGSRSNTWSKLHRLDLKGNVLASYDVPIGIEGIAFDAAGKLWAVTESGTRKYLRWGDSYTFPFVFEIDVSKLR
jgi:hypothetical protein